MSGSEPWMLRSLDDAADTVAEVRQGLRPPPRPLTSAVRVELWLRRLLEAEMEVRAVRSEMREAGE